MKLDHPNVINYTGYSGCEVSKCLPWNQKKVYDTESQ